MSAKTIAKYKNNLTLNLQPLRIPSSLRIKKYIYVARGDDMTSGLF